VELNQQPQQHVNKLFQNIIKNKYKSTIDNKVPECYEKGKKLLKHRIKKCPRENYIQEEHERELRSQAHRVQYCKSLAQRKKDNTDPITNPAYFMREPSDVNAVTIDKFQNTVLKKNKGGRPASAANPTRKQL
jgi:hypothetical protein